MSQLSESDKRRLHETMMSEKPPTLGVVGLSGVGKTSAINALFKTNLPISHVSACTKEFWTVPLEVRATRGDFQGQLLKLHFVDAPGLGEDKNRDPEYLRMYGEHLPTCDVILWILNARNRALALDQMYLEILLEFAPKIVFGLSQVDLVPPTNWKRGSLVPSQEQQVNIDAIVSDRSDRLRRVFGRDVALIPFASERGYNMARLYTALLKAAPRKRKWLFDPIMSFDLDAWIAKTPLHSSLGADERTPRPLSSHYARLIAAVREVFGIGNPLEMDQKLSTLAGRAVDSTALTEEELSELEDAVYKQRDRME